MRRLRAAALAAMLLGYAGVYAAVLSDPAENLAAAYVFGGIGLFGCALMFASGAAALVGIFKKKLAARNRR